ncbi:hypothetical protein Osc7112_4144 [Oscillatoria nigro-viridis PCC 7112]|uniref:Uncharacterized protein n=1 Tax=Phormidium nigroviride PCC 7112 TaxID=179408 RepID=K9VML6_9CYAN|nr:hypothetical protein [Oscillatoria nigro-viridis]AFZ08470.1 hypothetical protein Osc7112_4144 [Oscillatoria nigro-viridis PCC 7112]
MHSLIFSLPKKQLGGAIFYWVYFNFGFGECVDRYLLKIYATLKKLRVRKQQSGKGSAVSLQQLCRSPDRIRSRRYVGKISMKAAKLEVAVLRQEAEGKTLLSLWRKI